MVMLFLIWLQALYPVQDPVPTVRDPAFELQAASPMQDTAPMEITPLALKKQALYPRQAKKPTVMGWPLLAQEYGPLQARSPITAAPVPKAVSEQELARVQELTPTVSDPVMEVQE
jgi:hypothetical protein